MQAKMGALGIHWVEVPKFELWKQSTGIGECLTIRAKNEPSLRIDLFNVDRAALCREMIAFLRREFPAALVPVAAYDSEGELLEGPTLAELEAGTGPGSGGGLDAQDR